MCICVNHVRLFLLQCYNMMCSVLQCQGVNSRGLFVVFPIYYHVLCFCFTMFRCCNAIYDVFYIAMPRWELKKLLFSFTISILLQRQGIIHAAEIELLAAAQAEKARIDGKCKAGGRVRNIPH